jgi:TolB-like protein/DNA-binding winged helix-turn-helix (wHTH) protein/Tfp pilus assembly protein PilF
MGVRLASPYQFEGFQLDVACYELRRNGHVLKLEKIPMELLILLISRRGELVSREEIIAKLWGQDVFIETEHGINTAVRKIRQTLGDDPERPRFVQTVVGKGYRFVGPIDVVDAAPAVDPSSAPVPVIEEGTGRSRSKTIPRWVVKASAAALILVVAAAIAVKYFDWGGWLPRPPVRSIAVLPLKNLSGNSADEYFADGMTDELITNLAKISALRVSSYTSVSKYKTTSKSLPQIAQELQVDGIVEGSVVRSGDQIRITAQLIYAPRDQHLWAEEYQRYVRDVLYLQREVAGDIAQQVRVTLTPNERKRLATAGAVDPAAYESYLRGRSFWNQRTEASLLKAIDQFNKAIEVDAEYAPAYSGLADCYTTLGYLSYLDPLDAFPRARDAATKALELDSSLAEAHTSLAYYDLYHAWNWVEAENEFKKAIELNPNYATAHDWYSYYLMAMGRFDEAWREVNRAHELDPLSVTVSTDIGFNYFYRRNYDEAINQLRTTLSLSPKFPLAHLWLGRAYQQKKMYAEAVDEFNKTDAALPGWVVTIAGMGNAYGEWGHKVEAEQVLVRLNEMARAKYVTPYGIALVYAGLGDKNEAFVWLNKAVEGRSHWLVWLNRDPRWDRLRSDSRFDELKKRVALP